MTTAKILSFSSRATDTLRTPVPLDPVDDSLVAPAVPPPARVRRGFLKQGWVVLAFIGMFHALAIAALAFPLRPIYLPIMLAMYLWMAFGTTLYLHRCLAHRGFDMVEPLRAFFACGVALSFMRNPIWWAGQHRVHHQKTDRPGDVHSPNDGIFHSHVGWVATAVDHAKEHYMAARGLEATWYTRFFGHPGTQLGLNILVAVALGAAGGPGAALWCLYVPLVLCLNVTWSVNSVCHMWGYRTFDTPDNSRNNHLIALLALGEGYHNNHHQRPQRVRAGLRWHEPDVTSGLIWALERLGLVWNVRWEA